MDEKHDVVTVSWATLLHLSAWPVRSCSLSWLSHSLSLQSLCSSCACMSWSGNVHAGFSAGSARLVCPVSSTCGSTSYPPAECCSRLLQLASKFPQKLFLQGLTHSLFWSPHAPNLQGSKAGSWAALSRTDTNQVHICKRKRDLTLCRHHAKGWLLWGRGTVWLPICVPLIQRMKTFPLVRAKVKPPAALHTSTLAQLGDCRCLLELQEVAAGVRAGGCFAVKQRVLQ